MDDVAEDLLAPVVDAAQDQVPVEHDVGLLEQSSAGRVIRHRTRAAERLGILDVATPVLQRRVLRGDPARAPVGNRRPGLDQGRVHHGDPELRPPEPAPLLGLEEMVDVREGALEMHVAPHRPFVGGLVEALEGDVQLVDAVPHLQDAVHNRRRQEVAVGGDDDPAAGNRRVDVADLVEQVAVHQRLVHQVRADATHVMQGGLVDDSPEQFWRHPPLRLRLVGLAVRAENAVGVAAGEGLDLEGAREGRDRTPGQAVFDADPGGIPGSIHVVPVDLERTHQDRQGEPSRAGYPIDR